MVLPFEFPLCCCRVSELTCLSFHSVQFSPGFVVKASTSGHTRALILTCVVGIFHLRLIPVTEKLALKRLPCKAPGVLGSGLGLVDPLSGYCDWVRWKV